MGVERKRYVTEADALWFLWQKVEVNLYTGVLICGALLSLFFKVVWANAAFRCFAFYNKLWPFVMILLITWLSVLC